MGSNLLAAIDFGPYVAWWKLVPFLLLFFVWVRVLTWIDKDVRQVMLPREPINAGMMVGLMLAVAGFFLLPGFGLAMGAFVVLMLLSLGAYIGIRANKAGTADLSASLMNEFGSMFKRKGKSEKEELATGDFIFTPKTGAPIRRPDEEDPNRLGYDAMCIVLLEPMVKGAHTVELAPGGEMTGSRFYVDGVAYEGQKLEKSQAAEAIALVKRICQLDLDERRKPQTGKFKMAFAGEKHEVQIKTQGSSAGESLRMEFDVAKRYQFTAPELGFTADQLQYFQDTRDEDGLVLLAMPKGMGLTTLEYAMLRNHDAFVSHILTIERDPPLELEGVSQNKLGRDATPEEEAKMVSWVASQEPHVLLVSSVSSPDSARELISLSKTGRRSYVGLKAGDVFETIEQWRKIVGDDRLAMSQVKYVVAGRVFRRLCDATKIPYAPDEKLLKQLGMQPNKVTELYKENFGPLRDAKGNEIPDEFCHNLGFKGRFGVYELFVVDDEVRAAVASNAGSQALRTLFRKQKRKYLQELALVRVENGETSVKEFLRVLKPTADESRKPTPRNPGGGGGAPPSAPKPGPRIR